MLRVHALTWPFIAFIAFVAFAVQACGGKDEAEPQYDYSAIEMRSVIEGTWIGQRTDAEADAGSVSLTLAYAPAYVHAQCGNRVLDAEGLGGNVGPRCMDASQMNVRGSFDAEGDGAIESVTGYFEVPSLRFYGGGQLDLGIGDDQRLTGELTDGVLTVRRWGRDEPLGQYSLKRASR